MSDETLRDLLEERVADLAGRDLAAGSWEAATRLRRRRRTTALAGVAAATALVVGVTALVARDPGPAAAPAAPGPSASPDAVVDGAHVWWSPDLAEEAALPRVDSVLPPQVDVAGAPDVADRPIGRVRAALAVLDESGELLRVVLVATDGTRALDVSRLDPVERRSTGYRLPPVGASMLSPDGRTLAFPQDDGIAFYDVQLRTWRDVPIGGRDPVDLRWAGPRLLVLADGSGLSVDGTPVDLDLSRPRTLGLVGDATAHGPWLTAPDGVASAQAYDVGALVPARGASYSVNPETLVVQDGTAPEVLAISSSVNDGRFKQCCPVAGWLDDDTLAYESRSAEPRLLAWDVGTRRFGLVTRIVGLSGPGESYVGSYADLS